MNFEKSFYVEFLYVLRPVVYFSLMIKLGKNSFIPLLVNVVMDLVVLKINKRTNEKFMQQKIYSSEYSYRYGRLAIYLLREPIFSMITKPAIEKILKLFRFSERITNFLINILNYFTKFYYVL